MTNSADPDQLASSEKPTDLDPHCLQRQGISRFSISRVYFLVLFTFATCVIGLRTLRSKVKFA